MTKNLSDKSCQTIPIDWNNVQAKCPCCKNDVKVDLNYGPDSSNIVLVPFSTTFSTKQSGVEKTQITSNSSLMNIVSVGGVGEHGGRTSAPYGDNNQNNHQNHHQNNHHHHHHQNNQNMHDDDSEMNESTSSSLSNSSINRVIEPEIQITTLDFIPSKPMRPSSDSFLKNDSSDSLKNSSDSLLKNDSSDSILKNGSSALTSSAFSHFPSQGIRLKCQFHGCEMVLDGPQQLELHYKEHKGEKIQKCNWYNCSRLFSSKEKLRNHVRCRHTGERPHKCGECGKAFTSGKHLKDHSLLHTDFRPFMCEWEGCGVKFRRRHHLVAHKRVHTKERPFGCQFPGCDMKFTKTHHVKRHYDTHFKSTAYRMFMDTGLGLPVSSPGTVGTQSSSLPPTPTALPSTPTALPATLIPTATPATPTPTALPITPVAGYMFMS